MLKEPADLVGREVTAVAFSRDGVEFHFSGPILRSRTAPQVVIGEATYCFPKPGSRDALCWVIGATVQSLSLDESRHLEFTTSNGCRVRLPIGAGGVLHFRADQLLQVG
ncbi:hypothetical protein SAMN02990966_00305 [Rhodospirillales bacterium URHD0017]|nr:hypothetical protein SAMN02990966_00305 [Rhodospirillales bacterium URHD0017]